MHGTFCNYRFIQVLNTTLRGIQSKAVHGCVDKTFKKEYDGTSVLIKMIPISLTKLNLDSWRPMYYKNENIRNTGELTCL